MKITLSEIQAMLSEKGLKVTPQRIAIMEVVYSSDSHPNVENILEEVRKKNPSVASGTVYNVLDTLVEHKLIRRVTNDGIHMRYDGKMEKHHHLYSNDSDEIQDYKDEELDRLLKNYFADKHIDGFQIEDISLQIKGTFKN